MQRHFTTRKLEFPLGLVGRGHPSRIYEKGERWSPRICSLLTSYGNGNGPVHPPCGHMIFFPLLIFSYQEHLKNGNVIGQMAEEAYITPVFQLFQSIGILLSLKNPHQCGKI